ncbi:MAG: Na/Pi cotransporter family protein [Bacteroidales bacterium]|nr:Na/Pi cotransporter family protein [Bacteroidales bacterium]
MNIISILTAILMLTAGIGVFLVACKALSTNLENANSQKLKELFAKTGKNKWLGVGIGTLGTAAIQSSGAVTVMVIGFVNVGIMSLAQAATIIYGANIGTTITAQIVALGMFGGNGISATIIFSAFAGIGAFMSMGARQERWKQIGGILTGFGLLFVGLHIMSNAMANFASLDSVKNFLASISNPILLVLIGTLLTALIQSSSVLTSIAITMVFSGLISLDQGIYMTMGSNIGSCVVAIIAGMSSGTNAKRTALIHLFFNVMGVILFLFIALLLHIFSGGSASFGTVIDKVFPYAPQLQLALFHTVFNVCTTLVALPMTNMLVNTATRLIPGNTVMQTEDLPHLYYLDETMLRTPVVAVRQVKAEIENMADMAMQNFQRAIHIVTTLKYDDIDKFRSTEKELNYLNGEVTSYVARLSGKPLNKSDVKFLNTSVKSVSDLERIGDYAENIVEYADSLKAQKNTFSEPAIKEINEMYTLLETLYGHVRNAYHNLDFDELEKAYQVEDRIDLFTETMEAQHIQRLISGECTPQVGAEYISLAQNAERIGDHLINVGKSIRKFA